MNTKSQNNRIFPIFREPLVLSDLELKFYCPLINSLISQKTEEEARSFLEIESQNKRVTPYSGLGFIILSNKVLNVLRWEDNSLPSLKKNVYSFDSEIGLMETIKSASIDPPALFGLQELEIATHEKNQWLIYLSSQKTKADKHTYLSDFLKGDLK